MDFFRRFDNNLGLWPRAKKEMHHLRDYISDCEFNRNNFCDWTVRLKVIFETKLGLNL